MFITHDGSVHCPIILVYVRYGGEKPEGLPDLIKLELWKLQFKKKKGIRSS